MAPHAGRLLAVLCAAGSDRRRADAWESGRGLDPDDASDGPADQDGDGYTNLEDYLHSLY